MLSERNETISPFAILLILAYPTYELLRTFFRRLFSKSAAFQPDTRHLHSKVYSLVLRRLKVMASTANPLAATFVFCLPAFCCIWGVIFFQSSALALTGLVLFVVAYEVCDFVIRN